MLFKDIIGQDQIKSQLIKTVQEGRVSHAQLFLGNEGSGALPLALAYAQYINCEDRQLEDSCGVCSSCRKYSKLVHPDLHFSYPFFSSSIKDGPNTAIKFIEEWRSAFLSRPYMGMDYWRDQLVAENKQANINIAEAHRIIKSLSLKAFEAEYKVLIMWLPEYLEVQGNALLKLIEEPPPKTLFLLVSENQDKILSTIISRTQLVKVKPPRHDEIRQYLEDTTGLSPEKSAEIALISSGNVQLALELVSEDGKGHFDLFLRWMRACVTDSGLDIIRLSEEELSSMGRENQKSFLLYAVNMMRQLLLLRLEMTDLVHLQQAEREFAEKFVARYAYQQIEASITHFEEAHYHIERNANPKILFLDLSLQLALIFKYATIRQKADTI